MRRSSWPLPVLIVWLLTAASQAQEPTINDTAPRAVKPGATTDVLLTGANLAEATGLWTSFPCKVNLSPDIADNGTKADQVTFRLELPADAPLGVHGLRVVTKKGVSPLRLFVVDDLPTAAQQANNTSPGTAQQMSLPCAVDGAVANLTRHYFKFTAAAGQRLTLEVLARRMGSALDPMIRLLDTRGHELIYSDDAPGLSADSQFMFTFRDAGEYVLEVRDIRYQGGGTHTFRLRIGDFPCVTVPYPMAVARGSDATMQFAGFGLEQVPPVHLPSSGDPSRNWLNIAAKRDGGSGSGFATLAIVDRPQFLEQEPNNEQSQANRVELGTDLNGRFEQPGDADRFLFTAKKGQQYTFAGITRQAGSPTDLYIRLLKADGSQLAVAEDNGPSEGSLAFSCPEDGDYTLVVEDLHHRGGTEFAYWITTEPTQPGFILTASTDTLNVPAGGTMPVTVTAARQNFNGPIEVNVSGLPDSLRIAPTVIGPGRNSVVLTLQANPDAPAGQLMPVSITGTAQIGERAVQETAKVADVLKARFNAMPLPPPTLATAVAAAVAPAPAFTLRTEPAKLVFGQNLHAKLKVSAQRTQGFDEAITLAVTPEKDGLPAGITAAVAPIPKGQNEVEVTFTANDKAPLGEFTAAIQGTLKQDKTTAVQVAPGIRLALQAPLTLKLDAGEAKLKRGGQLAVKVLVERNPALAGPVTISLQNLPRGVTIENITLPSSGHEYQLQLKAAADAAQGAVNNLTAKGQAAEGKAKFEAASPPITITVE